MCGLPDFAAGFEQSRPSRAVDGSVDPAASEQTRVRGVDDRVDGHSGDIAFENRDLHASSLTSALTLPTGRRSLETP